MRRLRYTPGLLLVAMLSVTATGQDKTRTASDQPYGIAFASFAPLNTDIFVANADGSDPKPLLPHPDLDYDASFSADGRWVVFTSMRNGSADIYRVHPDGSGLERLTNDPAFDDQAALSPDGRSLAFVSSRSGQADIWVLELSTGVSHNVTNDPAGDFRPSWSADGTWLAFSSDRASKKRVFGFTTGHFTEIYVTRPDGLDLRQITHLDAFAGSPVWSADGTRLMYYEAPGAEVGAIGSPLRKRATTQVVSIDLSTSERQVLTTGPGEKWSPHWIAGGRIGYASGGPDGGVEFVSGGPGARGEVRSPSWSADGTRMVFHRDVETRWPPFRPWPSRDERFSLVRTGILPSYSPDGHRVVMNDETAAALHNNILIMDADGSGRSILFSDPQRSALAPAWSPRGDRIAFGIGFFFQGMLGPSKADIAMMRTDGSKVDTLTDGAGNYGLPSWSPDGRQIVYRSAGGNHNGLFILDIETRAARALTTGAGHENFPSWSPKGDRIAFTSDRDGDYEIYSIRPDGSDLKRLTHSAGNDAHNAWSPDGAWIAFTSARGGFKDEAALLPYNTQSYGDLYVMRADGSEVRPLTDDQFEDGTPTWFSAPRAR